VDVLATAPRRRFWMSPDFAIIYAATILGVVVGAVVKATLAHWNTDGIQTCISTGTATAYCHNIESYPIVLQWTYAAIAGWTTFFAAWLGYTLAPRIWLLL
jgi:hypothetical protein